MPTQQQERIAEILEDVFWNQMVGWSGDLNDLEQANRLLFQCILNAKVGWESAMSPRTLDELMRRVGQTTILGAVTQPSAEELRKAMGRGTNQKALHRFPNNIADRLRRSGLMLQAEYGGDFRNVWQGTPTGAELMTRLKGFSGISQKIAALLARLIACDFGVPLADGYASLEVPEDTHIFTVFPRSGLTTTPAKRGDIQAISRELRPNNPAVLDGAWLVGMKYCHKHEPECGLCPLEAVCERQI